MSYVTNKMEDPNSISNIERSLCHASCM